MLSLKKEILSVLLCVYVLYPIELFGYAWERGKGKKYIDYSATFDSGYKTSFHYELDSGDSIHFKDNTRKLILSRYDERGLSNRFTLISKIDIQRISSNLNIHRKEEADYVDNNDPFKNETKSYTMRSERIYLKDFKTNMNFMAVDYEIGMRTLLHKGDNQRISFDTVLGFPAAIQGEGGYDVLQILR